MALVFPQIEHRPAWVLLNKLQHVKAMRYAHEISRAYFLKRWRELRDELHETEDYKALRRMVYARAGGICEKCQKVPGNQMCHKTAVAMRPDLALRPDNVYLGCDSCHQEDHPDIVLSYAEA